ncbi:MAG TPA: hypothetical protein DCS54_01200, partial [Oribacterium sp.]|nr:hypothetical protein [Oribacterium sp.]
MTAVPTEYIHPTEEQCRAKYGESRGQIPGEKIFLKPVFHATIRNMERPDAKIGNDEHLLP